MGTRLAPSYANLFMADFEDKFVYTYPDQPRWWKQYIDDIFLLWTLGREKLDKFITHLNNCHPSIKFTAHISDSSADFLDTTVKWGSENKLLTDLHTKVTDSHNYLHYNSSHPRNMTRNLPYSQFLRLKCICSLHGIYSPDHVALKPYMMQRSYTGLDAIRTLKTYW